VYAATLNITVATPDGAAVFPIFMGGAQRQLTTPPTWQAGLWV